MTHTDWLFADRPNDAVFTTRQVLNDGEPILYVSHDADDGAWQFHTGGVRGTHGDAMIVGLGTMLRHDPTLRELYDLPEGWFAERDGVGKPWRRRELPAQEGLG